MRSPVALVVTLVVLAFLVVYAARPNAGPTAELPRPSATATPPMSVSSTEPLSPSPMASPAPSLSGIDVKAHVVSVPRDFRYVTTPSRLLVLDVAVGNATEV